MVSLIGVSGIQISGGRLAAPRGHDEVNSGMINRRYHCQMRRQARQAVQKRGENGEHSMHPNTAGDRNGRR
jgi:hypothetical protein